MIARNKESTLTLMGEYTPFLTGGDLTALLTYRLDGNPTVCKGFLPVGLPSAVACSLCEVTVLVW